MQQQLLQSLRGVINRLRLERGIRWMTMGVLVGACGGAGMATARLFGVQFEMLWLSLTPFVGAAIGMGLGTLLRPTALSAARLVDTYYRMKDGTVTALDFAGRASQEPLQLIHIRQTLQDLSRVNPQAVVPLRAPQTTSLALLACGLMAGLMLVPSLAWPDRPTLTEPLQVVKEQAQALEESMVEELRELAEKHATPQLQELAQEIEKLVEELKAPEIDQREALAKLSEMQQAVTAAMEQFNLEQIDAQLQELASALAPSQSMQQIAAALKDGKYEKAANELEKIDTSTMNRKERHAVAENLKKYSAKLGEGKEGKLSEAAQEISEGLESENERQCNSGACKAAGVCRSQSLKKSISECLGCQLNRLSQCKGACKNNGGLGVGKSDSPKNSWGRGITNQPQGEEKTALDSTRIEEKLTGAQGDGPSEQETSNAPEGRQNAARSYQEKYTEFRKQMEAVIDSEPLPLGHRETVRRYFESIRPTNAELANEQ